MPPHPSASGLYYLSELVEEHTVMAKKLLTRMIYTVIATQILLVVVDRFPVLLGALSIASHVVYFQNLRRFPIVKLTDPVFLLSCGKKPPTPVPSSTSRSRRTTQTKPRTKQPLTSSVSIVLVILNHYLYFRHFSAPPPSRRPPTSYPSYTQQASIYDSPYDDYPSFTEIASFFGLCVWLVPFSLFVSLSAGENVLPSMGSEYATGEGSNYARAGREPGGDGRGSVDGRGGGAAHNAGLAKALVDGVRSWFGGMGEVIGLGGGKAKHRF